MYHLARTDRLAAEDPGPAPGWGALETIAHYLSLLEEAYLVAALPRHGASARRRAAPPKLVTLSNAMLAVMDSRDAPDPGSDPTHFGAWVENACLAHAWNAGQTITYFREEPYEVDMVLSGSWGHYAIEVKTGAVATTELHGLLEFTRRFPLYRPLLLSDERGATAAERAGIARLPWREFLLKGPGGAR